jgi:hypothetical protein
MHILQPALRLQAVGIPYTSEPTFITEERTMKKLTLSWIIFLSALVTMGLGALAIETRAAGPSDEEVQDMARSMGRDPKQCEAIQNQVNRLTSISESSMSDDEKVSKLSEALAESKAGMQKSAQKDPEVDKAVSQYLVLIEDLVSAARASATGADKNVSAAVTNDLKRLTILTKNYVAIMKLMCPRLTLPEPVNK